MPAGKPVPEGIYLLPADRNWTYYTGGALPDYLSSISAARASHVDVSILDGVDVTDLIGAQVLVGYGTDDQEMLAAGRYRAIYTVQDAPPPNP